MANRVAEIDRKPLAPQSGCVAIASGTTIAPIVTKFVIVFTVSGNLTIQCLDGTSVTLSSMPTGYYTFDVQTDKVTWTGTATAAGFYHMAG